MFIVGGNQSSGGYEVANSLRFNDDDAPYLDRTPASASNQKTFTYSFWVKRANISTAGDLGLVGARVGSTLNFFINFQNSNQIESKIEIGGVNYFLVTTALYRDPSAWYHIVFAVDTTQATASNRVKLYVNGEQVTSFSTEQYPPQNGDTSVNAASPHYVGAITSGSNLDGYMAEVVFIDGQALDATSFGEFDEDSGIWKPIDVSGLTFGTNGLYLDFEDSAALGDDVSGNGNDFTVNNLTAVDQSLDTCTNNYCTLNPLFRGGEVGETLEEGNLFYDSGDDRENFVCATQSVSTGKWYFEILPSSTDTNGAYGFTNADNLLQTTSLSTSSYDLNIGGMIRPDGNGTPDYKINSTSTTISVTTTSVFGIALDADTGDIEFFENNVSVGSGTITGITNYIPFANCHSQSTGRRGIATFNFGQDSSFAGSKTRQNNTDNNGQGDFYYAPPSGYLSLCTKNLSEVLG